MFKPKTQKANPTAKANAGKGKDKDKGKGKMKAKPKEVEIDEEQDDELLDRDDDLLDTDDIDNDDLLEPIEFWKMIVHPNKAIPVEEESPGTIISVTQATFGEQVNKGSRTVVCCTVPPSKDFTPICVLHEGTNETQRLNLRFSSAAIFSLKGHAPSTVYLTGYTESQQYPDMADMDEDDVAMHEALASRFRRQYPGEEDDIDENEDEDEEIHAKEPVTKKKKDCRQGISKKS